MRDEYRTDYDGGRGGYGKIIAQKVTPNTMERWWTLRIYYNEMIEKMLCGELNKYF